MGKPRWEKQTFKLPENHRWTAAPGYTVFVANRGGVIFEFPLDWVVIPGDDAIKFHNRQPPDDDCRLQLTVFHLPQGIDWSGLSLTAMLQDAVSGEDGREIGRGPMNYDERHKLELAWIETRWIDPGENREAHTRTAIARGSHIQPLFTFDFWADDARRFVPVWEHLMRTLRLGEYIENPFRGPKR